MNRRISEFSLGWKPKKDILPGMRVCPANSVTSVGTVVNVKPAPKYSYSGCVIEVVWGTGKKRGKKLVHSASNLSDLDAYINAIRKELQNLEALRTEASTLGM